MKVEVQRYLIGQKIQRKDYIMCKEIITEWMEEAAKAIMTDEHMRRGKLLSAGRIAFIISRHFATQPLSNIEQRAARAAGEISKVIASRGAVFAISTERSAAIIVEEFAPLAEELIKANKERITPHEAIRIIKHEMEGEVAELKGKLKRAEAKQVTEFNKGFVEGQSAQAICELQGRDRFVADLHNAELVEKAVLVRKLDTREAIWLKRLREADERTSRVNEKLLAVRKERREVEQELTAFAKIAARIRDRVENAKKGG